MSEEYEGNETKLEKLEGSVERIIYTNEENGYTICDMASSDGGNIVTAVGIMPMIGAGDSLCLYGTWVHNPKYGRQFSVTQYERVMPADTASMLRYLASRAIKGIGPKIAQRIIDEFGEDSFDVIENHPEWLASSIKGLSLKTALAASESFKEQSGIRSAMMFFRDYFGAATTVKIYKQFGSASVDIAKKNPYRLCNEVDGIGFERADHMARELGFDNFHTERVMSGVRYVLTSNAMQNGHVCLPREKLKQTAAMLLSVGEDDADEAISNLLRMGALKYVMRDERQMIYDRDAYDAEKYIAKKLFKLDSMCASIDLRDIDSFIDREELKSNVSYATLQRSAISDALRYGVMILTGGPGTGKTTVVKALINIFESMGYDVALAAPTGRAAKRMSEATSREAKTIHRLLEYSFDSAEGYSFGRNETNLLDEQVIIVDEASMIDNALMCALLKAIKPGARFIIIGDSDQLPSVGSGNVLCDMIDSRRFATVKLTEIFRQARESLIITNAHAVNNGQMPTLDIKDNDFFFLKRGNDRDIAWTVVDLCANRLPKTYKEIGKNGIQVICPSRKGESGTESLNILLQKMLNPPSQYKKEYRFRDRVFREGDRVMQTRNNYDIEWNRDSDSRYGFGIFNGDVGIIEKINTADSSMTIVFDDKTVIYDFSLLEDLEHAYAITVHKSQGSEYPIVIIPACHAPSMLLSRNLLYTAITRAEKTVIIVGSRDIVAQMVENYRQTMRYTGLTEWLKNEI
ncbi:MAG: ATP-dependent RecD-like DNA helicase [Ruminococcaceae bacterium]|nr:ATP-dependent RecD-like DNA helicase [Oscillospiraceae bacterium]